MIDVVFNLVIFFLVASHFARNEASEPVQLPSATQTAEQDENPHRLVVSILATGEISVAGNVVQRAAVEQMIDEGAVANRETFAVHIRADKAAPYRAVEPIMQACARKGVVNVGFKVIER